jgi:transposase
MGQLPDWVLRHKKKGTEVRRIGDKYRLYKISSKWNPEKKRSQKITEKYLGTITPEGLIPPKPQGGAKSMSNLSVLDYGPYELVRQLNEDVLSRLQEFFLKDWERLWCCAVIRFVHRAPVKLWAHHYQASFLREQHESLNLSGKSMSSWLRHLGNYRKKMVELLGCFSQGQEHLLIDSTHITSLSRQLGINQPGYNSKKTFDPQVNLLALFNSADRLPVYYRVLPGNVRDVKSMKLSIDESRASNVVLIGDKGFYSQANAEHLQAAGLDYILPLRRNSSLIDYSPLARGRKAAMQGYFKYADRPIWYTSQEVEAGRVWVFFDNRLKVREEQDYLSRIEAEQEGYSMDKFLEREVRMGTLALLTNCTEWSAQRVYQAYKTRGAVEQMFDVFKNLLEADRTYMHNDKAMESWMFINFLSLLFYYRLYNLLLEKDLLKKYAVNDLLVFANPIRKVNVRGVWFTSEYPAKVSKILEKLGTPIT